MLKRLLRINRNVLNPCLIAFAGAVIYSNSFQATFHFDDIHSIVENYAIHRFDLGKIFSTSSRPVLDLTFALNYYFGKLDVFGYHLVNLVLHIANGIMLYFILFWTLNPKVRDPSGAGSINFKVPLYAGLIFIVHPVQTQAVTYIVSRSSVLAASFYLLTFLLFIKAFRSPRPTPYFVGAFLASCLGMGTKQEAATIPVMLLLYDYYFISKGDLNELKRHSLPHLAVFSTLLIVLYLSLSALNTFVSFDYARGVQMPQGEVITSFQYFLTQLHVIPYYIKLLFIPTNLNLDYDWPITRQIDFPTSVFFVLIASLIIFAVWIYRRNKPVSFFILWFFVTLSVTSSFVVIYDVIFEHRLYLPSIGFAAVTAFLIGRISGQR